MSACPTCGKLRYTQRATAKREAKRLRLIGRKHMSVYQCGGYWHVGTTPHLVVTRGIQTGYPARKD
jgi:hypothetical protein